MKNYLIYIIILLSGFIKTYGQQDLTCENKIKEIDSFLKIHKYDLLQIYLSTYLSNELSYCALRNSTYYNKCKIININLSYLDISSIRMAKNNLGIAAYANSDTYVVIDSDFFIISKDAIKIRNNKLKAYNKINNNKYFIVHNYKKHNLKIEIEDAYTYVDPDEDKTIALVLSNKSFGSLESICKPENDINEFTNILEYLRIPKLTCENLSNNLIGDYLNKNFYNKILNSRHVIIYFSGYLMIYRDSIFLSTDIDKNVFDKYNLSNNALSINSIIENIKSISRNHKIDVTFIIDAYNPERQLSNNEFVNLIKTSITSFKSSTSKYFNTKFIFCKNSESIGDDKFSIFSKALSDYFKNSEIISDNYENSGDDSTYNLCIAIKNCIKKVNKNIYYNNSITLDNEEYIYGDNFTKINIITNISFKKYSSISKFCRNENPNSHIVLPTYEKLDAFPKNKFKIKFDSLTKDIVKDYKILNKSKKNHKNGLKFNDKVAKEFRTYFNTEQSLFPDLDNFYSKFILDSNMSQVAICNCVNINNCNSEFIKCAFLMLDSLEIKHNKAISIDDFKNVEKKFKTAEKWGSNNEYVLNWGLAKLYEDFNSFTNSIEHYKAANSNNRFPLLYSYIGDLYAKQYIYDSAAKYYEKAFSYGVYNLTEFQVRYLIEYFTSLGAIYFDDNKIKALEYFLNLITEEIKIKKE